MGHVFGDASREKAVLKNTSKGGHKRRSEKGEQKGKKRGRDQPKQRGLPASINGGN